MRREEHDSPYAEAWRTIRDSYRLHSHCDFGAARERQNSMNRRHNPEQPLELSARGRGIAIGLMIFVILFSDALAKWIAP